MSKYVIHACGERLWYVNEYLIPSMLAQGISKNDISVWADRGIVVTTETGEKVYTTAGRRGNLFACMDCFQSMPDDEGSTWHMQDDVIICSDFKKKTEELEDAAPVVCGFCFRVPAYISPAGPQDPNQMWYSFQCIKIKNKIARECAKWFFTEAQYDGRYYDFVRTKKGDDSMFKIFMQNRFPGEKIALNYKPSLVEHIDDLIGGSSINQERKMKEGNARGEWFAEPALIDDLKASLENRGKKAVVYAGTRNLYGKMLAPIRSLLVNNNIDQVFLLIEDDVFPYPLPPEVKTINVRDRMELWKNSPNMQNGWGYMVLLRSEYWKLFPHWNKILSLDVDTIVMDNIEELWDIDLDGYYAAGVREPLKSAGGQQMRAPLYVNFGVVMYNLAAMRDGLGEAVAAALQNEYFTFSEQDCFNKFCEGKIRELDSCYNDTRYWLNFHITSPCEHTKILHYAAVKDYFGKPEYVKYDKMRIEDEEGNKY